MGFCTRSPFDLDTLFPHSAQIQPHDWQITNHLEAAQPHVMK
jgi:hypothetical protein